MSFRSPPYDEAPRAANSFRAAPGGDPPELTGRDDERARVRTAIMPARERETPVPLAFTGLRGMGKTALLRRALAEARAAGGVVLSAEAASGTSLFAAMRRSVQRARDEAASLSRRIGTAFDALAERASTAGLAPSDGLGSRPRDVDAGFLDALADVNAAVRRVGRFLVVTLDELHEASAAELLGLMAFVHGTAGSDEPVLFLGAGLPSSTRLLRDARSYAERWRHVRLELLTEAAADAAFVLPAAARGVEIEPELLVRLREYSAGYPFFIQEYGSRCWPTVRGGAMRASDAAPVLTATRAELERTFYGDAFRRLTPRELRYAFALAEFGPGEHCVGDVAARLGTTSAKLSSVRNQLVRKDVCYAPWGGTIEFRIPLTHRFLRSDAATSLRRLSRIRRTSVSERARPVPRRPDRGEAHRPRFREDES